MDRWSTFCTVCTIPVTEHYTRADSGIKNTTDSLDAFWGRARALIRPGKWSSVGIVGPCGDFVEKVSDEMLWDSMPEDAEGLMQEFDFNVDSDNDDDENEAFPFHTFCAKLLDQEMKRRQLDLKDLFNFLEDRSPQSNSFLHSKKMETGWSVPPHYKPLTACIKFFMVLPVGLLWTMARPDAIGSDIMVTTAERPVSTLNRQEFNKDFIVIFMDEQSSVASFLAQGLFWPPLEPLKNVNESSGLLPLLGPLNEDIFRIIVGWLHPRDLLTLCSTNRHWRTNTSSLWLFMCEKYGYAHTSPTALNDDIDWRRAFFCFESRNRRRINKMVDWFATEVEIMTGVKERIVTEADFGLVLRAKIKEFKAMTETRKKKAFLRTRIEKEFGVVFDRRTWILYEKCARKELDMLKNVDSKRKLAAYLGIFNLIN